jgi:hypothetical protein
MEDLQLVKQNQVQHPPHQYVEGYLKYQTPQKEDAELVNIRVEISHGEEDMSAGEGLIEMEHKEDHDAIMSLISGDAMTGAEFILHDTSLPIPVKITKLLGIIMTLLESVQMNGAKISGTVKKAVSLQLLTRLIHFVASDSKDFDELIHLSQTMGPDILETLIEVSKGVNLMAVEKHKETCCFGLLSK